MMSHSVRSRHTASNATNAVTVRHNPRNIIDKADDLELQENKWAWYHEQQQRRGGVPSGGRIAEHRQPNGTDGHSSAFCGVVAAALFMIEGVVASW